MTDKRKKILFISHDSSLTGAPRELLLIVKHLNKTIYEPIVIIGKEGPLRKDFEQHAEVIHYDLFGKGIKYLREILSAYKRFKLIRSIKPDLIYCNTVMTSKWLFYAKLFDIPTITHIHELGYVYETLSSMDKYLLHNYTDIAICASTAVRKYLLSVSALNPSNILVFHESIEIPDIIIPKNSSLASQLRIDQETIVVGMIGRIAHMKGSDLFFDVAKITREMVSRSVKLKFLIIGGTPHVEGKFNAWLQDEIADSDIKDDIIITGSKENVDQYLSLLDIFLLPSREDPFPLVVLEAMSAAKPIIAFAVGGVPEELGNEAGILIDPLNINLMRDSIISLIKDPNKRDTLGKNARRRVEENFDIAKNINRLESIIGTTIGINHPK